MRKISLLLVFLGFIGLQVVFAQTRQITGVVTSSDDGTSIPGVSVVVKGSTLGTITDMDGKFTLKVPQSAKTLSVTFVGMAAAEVALTSASNYKVVMQSENVNVDEIVVTAMGMSSAKKSLGYSVQKVDADVLATKPNSDIVNSLAGRVSGVQITSSAGDAGASTYMTIRGASSITGNNQPLFVVNGMPIISGGGSSGVDGVNTSSRSIDLNPEDIESITVLKGGAATALYGLRAANGVLIITTKSGKNLTSKKIEFHTSVGFDQISQTQERQSKFAQGLDGIWVGGNGNSWGPKIADLEYDGDKTYKWDPKGKLVAKGKGNGTPAQAYDPYEFFQTGLTTNNRLNISNGNENGTYYFSISNLDQKGIVPNNKYGRTTLRMNATTKLDKNVTLGTDFAYTNSTARQLQKGSNVSGVMLGLVRTATTFDNSAGYQFPDGTQRNYRNGGGYDNPYWTANNISFDENVNRFTGSGNLNIKFTNYLDLVYTAGIDWYNRRYTNKFAINSRARPTGYMDEYMYYTGVFNSDLLLNFNKQFGEKIKLKASVGNNFYSTFGKFLWSDATVLEIPDFYQLSNSATNTTSTGTSKYRTMAVFGDINVAFDNMLYLGLTGRNDWSTTMPEKNRSAFYPSASLGFVFTELSALKGNKLLSFGKLRGSIARTANIAGPYSTSNYYYGATSGDGWTTGVKFPYMGSAGFSLGAGLGNPDLKHETMDSWEIGTELKFLNNRIGLDVAYFYNKNKDLLLNVTIPASSGFISMYMNAASMERKGIEVTIDASIVKAKNLKWDLIANFTKLKNTVLALAPGVDNLMLGGFVTPQIRAVAGQDYGSIFGEDWARDENGKILINDDPTDNYRDGYPWTKPGPLVPIGNVNPDWTANVTNTITYKEFSLSFMWDIKKGGKMYNGTHFAMNSFGTSKETENREVYYTPQGTIDFAKTPASNVVVFDGVYGHEDASGNPVSSGKTNVTPIVLDQKWYQGMGSNFGGGPTMAAIESTQWIRLRDITISYNLPIKNKVIKSAQIYGTGKNLLLFTPYSGIDPETNLEGATSSQGMDYFNNPGTKSYLFGLKITF